MKKINKEIGSDPALVHKKGAILVRFLPSSVTIAAFCFGLSAIRFALFHRWELAILCIFVAALLDAFDGKVARLLGQSSQFGAELDSLSDLVCFGVAPAIILFLKSMYSIKSIGWGVCMFFTVCCALRLARFNAMQMQGESNPEWERKYFNGVPAPAGAILSLFPMILFFETHNYDFLNPKLIFCCMLVSGLLMISSLKTFSSKMVEVNNKSAPVVLMIISFLIICLITEIWLTLSIFVMFYLVSIPYGVYRHSKIRKSEMSKSCA